MNNQPSQEGSPGRKIPLPVALFPLVFMAALLGVGYGVYKIRPQVLLVVAALFTGTIGLILRFSWKEMQQGIVDSIHKAMPAILIMLCVGILIGAWISCGTIPLVVY
jgi:NhaC family Na+:H+ antiporter